MSFPASTTEPVRRQYTQPQQQHSSTLPGGNCRDVNIYGTYPRHSTGSNSVDHSKQNGNIHSQPNQQQTHTQIYQQQLTIFDNNNNSKNQNCNTPNGSISGHPQSNGGYGLKGILRNRHNDYSPIQAIYGETGPKYQGVDVTLLEPDPILDTAHDTLDSASELPFSQPGGGIYSATYTASKGYGHSNGVAGKPCSSRSRVSGSRGYTTQSMTRSPSSERFRSCLNRFDRYVPPAVAEFIAVLSVCFISTYIESALMQLTVQRILYVGIMAVLEGSLFGVFISTFHSVRIHLNPVITLASLFCGGISPAMGIVYWIMQGGGACLGVFCYQAVSLNEVHVNLPSLQRDVVTREDGNMMWFNRMYQLILCQSFATGIIALAYLMTQYHGLNSGNQQWYHSQNGRTNSDPQQRHGYQSVPGATCATNPYNVDNRAHVNAVSTATSIAAFMSLLVSTASWNPVRSLAVCVVSTINGIDVPTWTYHWAFWLGPFIGSLFATFLYRLIFAEDHQRLFCCRRDESDDEDYSNYPS